MTMSRQYRRLPKIWVIFIFEDVKFIIVSYKSTLSARPDEPSPTVMTPAVLKTPDSQSFFPDNDQGSEPGDNIYDFVEGTLIDNTFTENKLKTSSNQETTSTD